ncbi:MAG: hypothetical protein QM730_09565 [Anaerolineales bacterium]
MEKEAMKNAIRKRLGLPLPKMPAGFGEQTSQPKPAAAPPKPSAGLSAILRFLGSDTLKLRYESGEGVIYRKHWVVLILDAWVSVLCVLGTVGLFLGRLIQLAISPDEAFISFNGGVAIDVWCLAYLIALIPFLGWFGYQVLDWSNDKFEVTNDQIIDIDRKPFGSETRNAAPLEGILNTFYERKGILGNMFNFGTVYIAVGGSKLAFEDVMDPAGVQSDIDRRRMIRTQKKNEATIAAERDRMAAWLATYHLSAKDFSDEQKKNQKPG